MLTNGASRSKTLKPKCASGTKSEQTPATSESLTETDATSISEETHQPAIDPVDLIGIGSQFDWYMYVRWSDNLREQGSNYIQERGAVPRQLN